METIPKTTSLAIVQPLAMPMESHAISTESNQPEHGEASLARDTALHGTEFLVVRTAPRAHEENTLHVMWHEFPQRPTMQGRSLIS